MTPGRQIVSSRMVFKQRMPRYIFSVEGELSVFSSYLQKQTVLKKTTYYLLHVIKLKLYHIGIICLWSLRKSHRLSKITDDMKDEINKTVLAGNLILGSFRKTLLIKYICFFQTVMLSTRRFLSFFSKLNI